MLTTSTVPAPQFAGRDAPSQVIAFAQKTLRDGNVISKLHVIELGGAAPGGAVKRNAELFFPPEFADDFPVSLQVCAGLHMHLAA